MTRQGSGIVGAGREGQGMTSSSSSPSSANAHGAVVLEAQNLVKQYPETRAVDGVSFSVPAGVCFGLLGPNGAGKTTTVEMMEGITPVTSGSVLYRGTPIGVAFRQRAGIQFQSTALQDFLTVIELLTLFRSFYDHGMALPTLMDMCALHDIAQRDHRKLSGGQRQRLLLALALVNDPDIVFLDEPTTGLDPQARRNFWELISGIRSAGKTIVLTTHYMDEAYTLCDTIAIMDHGKIIAQGTPAELLRESFGEVVVRLPDTVAVPEDLPWKQEHGGGRVEIFTPDVNATLAALMQANVCLDEVEVSPPTLEDLFLKLTGRDLRA